MPVLITYYVTAALTLFPGTFPYRLALLPVNLWLAFRAVITIDIALALDDPAYKFVDYGMGVSVVLYLSGLLGTDKTLS